MTEEAGANQPRLTGEAAWKAEREATEKRNAAVKRRAHEQPTPGAAAQIERERRLAVMEIAQLNALNKRLGARPADSE